MKPRKRAPEPQEIEGSFFPENWPTRFFSESRSTACIVILLVLVLGKGAGNIWPFLNLCPHRGAFPMVPGCRVFCICLRSGGAGHLYACPEGYRFNHEQERCTPDGQVCEEQQTCDPPSLLMKAVTMRMTSPKRECQDMVGAYCANRWELVICHPVWTHELGIVDCDRKGDGTGVCNLLTDACDKNRSSLWETLPGFDSALFGWLPEIEDLSGDNTSDIPAINFCKPSNGSKTEGTSDSTTEKSTTLLLLDILTSKTTIPTTTEWEYEEETTTPTTTEREEETTTPTTTESEEETTTPTTTESEEETTTPTTTECEEEEEESTTPTTTEREEETTTQLTTTETTTEFVYEDICHAIDVYPNVECASEGSWCLPDDDTLVTCGKTRMIRQVRSCRKVFATVGLEAACLPLVFGCSYWIENPTPDSWSPVSSSHFTDPQHEAYEAWFREHWCKTHGQQGVHCTPDGMSLAHCNESLMVDQVFDCASVMPRGIMTGCQFCEQGSSFCVYRPRSDLADKCGIPGRKDNHSAACGFTSKIFARPPNIGILDTTSSPFKRK